MYRSVLLSFVIVATACKVGANSASAANTRNAASGAVAAAPGQNANTSDTSGATAGPISTTETASLGSAANTAGLNTATGSTGPASMQSNSNRVPNEMGRIMVLEYHLITDHNGDYARERSQFRKDLELLYNRGYRPVNMSDVLDKKLNLPRGLSPVVFVFDDASPEQFRYINTNGKLEIDPTSGMGIWLDFRKTHPDWNNKAVYCLLSGASAGHNFFGDRGIQGQKSNWRFQKVKWLPENGFDLWPDTLGPRQLRKNPSVLWR